MTRAGRGRQTETTCGGDEDGGEGNSDSVRFPGLGMGGGTEEVGKEDEEEEFPMTEGDGEWGGELWGFGGETASTKVECMLLLSRRVKDDASSVQPGAG